MGLMEPGGFVNSVLFTAADDIDGAEKIDWIKFGKGDVHTN